MKIYKTQIYNKGQQRWEDTGNLFETAKAAEHELQWALRQGTYVLRAVEAHVENEQEAQERFAPRP